MEYKYFCQMHAAERKNKIVLIPNNTVIKKECLIGIDNDEFVKCLRRLQEIAANVYEDMIDNYAEYGIIADTGMKCPVNSVSCFGDVLYQIALIGNISGDSLIVGIKNFKDGVKKHKYKLILKKLSDNGFLITSYNGTSDLCVSFPDMPAIINTLKGFASVISKYIADVKPSYHMYTHDMFGCFQYRYAEDETTRKYPEPLFMSTADECSENGKRALYWLHDEADKYGYKMTSGFNTVINFMKGSKSFMSLRETGGKHISVILFLENVVNKHKNLISTLPEYLRQPFKENTCIFCGGIMSPGHGNTPSADGSCKQRFSYELDGNVINHCKRWFSFTDVKFDDLPLVFDLYKTENDVK